MKKELVVNFEVLSIIDLDVVEKKLFDKALKIREQAYAPYSSFLVGCSVLLENGEIYQGNNQENAAYPSGLCAERSVLYWIGANFPQQKIKKIFIVGGAKIEPDEEKVITPCGACRQSIMEYETNQKENIEIYFSSLNGETIYKVSSIKDLLPFSFDATFL